MTENMAELRHALSAKTLSCLGSREKANAGSWETQCVRYSVLLTPGKGQHSALFFFFSVVCYVTSLCQLTEG